MSVQLILFPQNYEGGFSAISADPNEKIVNGISFAGMDSTSSYSTHNSTNTSNGLNITANAPATVPNTWYRWRYSVSGTPLPTLPTVSSNNLVLSLNGGSYGSNRTGVYQRITNLVPGASYRVRIKFSSFTVGRVRVDWVKYWYPTAIIQSGYYNPGTTTTYPLSFTANGSAADFVIWASNTNTGAGNIVIESVSVIRTTQIPTGNIDILGDGQVICDLYEDEEIPLTLSVDEFKNAAEQVQSYSKAFMLPGTKRNNQIFENLFDVTRSSLGNQGGITFNPYAKTQCILKQDGFVLFEGYLKMIDIQDQEGEISYNVNLYSQVITLADILKDKKFNDLDFSELEHTYDKTSIKNSWYEPSDGTGLPLTNPLSVDSFAYDTTNQPAYGASQTNVLKYPFCDWEHTWLVADGFTGSNANLNQPELTMFQQAFRPFIQIKYLIDRIFNQDEVPFSYTSSFFNTADFKKLFMDFNWGSTPEILKGLIAYGRSNVEVLSTTSYANFPVDALGYDIQDDQFGFNTSTFVFTAQENNQSYTIEFNLVFDSLLQNKTLDTRIVHKNSGGTIINTYAPNTVTTPTVNTSFNVYGLVNILANQTDTIEIQFKTSEKWAVRPKISPSFGQVDWSNVVITTGAVTIATNQLLQSLRGNLNQWEFLKGIMDMFNLVSIPDDENPNNILIEPYGDIFINNTNSGNTNDLTLKSRSIAHDWTEKIDVSKMKLVPLTDLKKKLIFKFEEDEEDYTFMKYKLDTQNHLYGSKIYDATLTTGGLQSVLEGEEEIIASPFAATIPKAIGTDFDIIVPAIYSYNPDDGTSQGFNNLPRIMYNTGIKTLSKGSYYIPQQNGTDSENSTIYLQFSHFNEVPSLSTSLDFHYGECQYFPGVSTTGTINNLFNTYWLPYLNELYNSDTRIMTIKVNLTAGDINTFKFYDTVFIKNRQFRVNRIDYKPNDLSTVEFILIP